MGTVALDLDGTLVDARPRQTTVAAWALAQASGGRDAPPLASAPFWRAKRAGATTVEAFERLGVPADLARRAGERWREEIEADAWLDGDRRLPGVAGTLSALRRRELRLVVLTARRRPEGASRSLAAARLSGLVDEVMVVDPRRAVAEKSAALHALAPVAFVGDTETDGAAALAGGVRFAAVSTGQRSAGYLARHGLLAHRSLRAALRELGLM